MISLHVALLVLGSLTGTTQAPREQVYRCHGRHGETVFSGIPCRDRTDLQNPADADGAGMAGAAIGHCAETVIDIRDGVAAAFDSGNVNELARLFLWRGYGSRAAYRAMARLKPLLRQPLADLSLVPRPGTQWWKQDVATAADAEDLRVELAVPGMGNARNVYRFPVVQRNGCYWLKYTTNSGTDFP